MPGKVLGGALILVLVAPHPLTAQDDARARPPGILLTFDVAQSVQADTNLDLVPGDADAATQAVTLLDFGLLSETPAQRLSFEADAIARLVDGSSRGDTSFDGPDLSFGYQRTSADASLALAGSFSRREVAFLRDLDDFVDDDGSVDFPDDFDDLQGEGTRQSLSLDATLTLRQRARSGVTLTAGLDELDYVDTTSEDLDDSRRVSVGADLRLTLSGAAEANLGLRYSVFDEDGDDTRETLGFGAGLAIQRPDGQVSARLDVIETEDGTRTGLSFGRSLDLPLGGLSGTLGATRAASGEVDLTGALSFDRELPRGALRFALSRAVVSDSDDEERALTTLSAALNRSLTPRTTLSLDALYADSRSTGSGGEEDVRNLSLGASSSVALTPDWSLSLAYRHEIRDEEDSGRADNDSIALTLRRSFAGTL